MTKNKDLKRRVRARMEKTGESYTAARARIVGGPSPAEYAELASMSDDAVRDKTGRDWAGWVEWLDGHDATGLAHRDIAKLVRAAAPEAGGWWAQSVTVGYERIRGLRAKGQVRGSQTFTANKSRTFGVPLSTLYAAWADEATRREWLGDLELVFRVANEGKNMRITWPDGTSVHAYFDAKSDTKSRVAIQHVDLKKKKDIDRAKAEWAERLDALKALLESGRA